MDRAEAVAVEVALRLTGPAALTTELSIVAVTDWPPF
jgi:hypothetical protein